jgi:hypothetical protein
MYDIAKAVYPNVKHLGKEHYDRIMLALKRWKDIGIEFKGIFYENDNYTTT